MSVVRNLLIRAGADFSSIRNEVKKATTTLEKFKVSVKGILGSLAVGAGSIGLGAAINDAIQFEALMGTLSDTLGRSSADFVKWQNTVGDAMGFSKLEVAGMANNYSLRLKSIAKDEQDLFQKTTTLIKAAAVIRSKTGMSSIEISDRMRSAMNQEADGADELGVNVRVAAIQQSRAYKELANNQPWDTLAEGMKKTILYHHILDSVNGNFGDDIAQNTALLKGGFIAALNDVKLALGQAFLPIVNIILPNLTAFARSLARALDQVTKFMNALFGYKGGDGGATEFEDTAAGYEEVGDAAKKATGYLAGFDEVNSMKQDDSTAGGAGMTAGDMGTSMMDEAAGALESAATKAEEAGKRIREAIKNLITEEDKLKIKTALNELKGSFDRLKQTIESLVNSEGFKGFSGKLAEVLKDAAISRFAGAINILTGQIDLLNGAILWLKGLFSGDFTTMWEAAEEVVKGFLNTLEGFAYILLPGVGKAIEEMHKRWTEKWIDLKNSIKKYGDPAKLELSDFGNFIRDKIIEGFANAVGLTPGKMEELAGAIAIGWEYIKTHTPWQAVGDAIGYVWDTVKTNIGLKWEEIKKAVREKLEEVTGLDFDKINRTIEVVWNAIKLSASNMGDKIKESMKNAINDIIDMVNKFIKAFNNLEIKFPSVEIPGIGTIGGGTIDFPNLPTIPKLARGGIVDGKTNLGNYIAGEAGREMIVPLENTSFTDKIASALGTAVMTSMQLNQGQQSRGELALQLDGVTFARLIAPYTASESKRLGGPAITVK